jgi:hypothetical protein
MPTRRTSDEWAVWSVEVHFCGPIPLGRWTAEGGCPYMLAEAAYLTAARAFETSVMSGTTGMS